MSTNEKAILDMRNAFKDETLDIETRGKMLQNGLKEYSKDAGVDFRMLCHILRVALFGKPVGPPLFQSMIILGPQVLIERVKRARTVFEESYNM